jgi:aerobic carbon-monoxide dehydrogenase small subunit
MVSKKHTIELTVNGKPREGLAEPRRTLADFLRDDLELTGTHLGCEHGVCGACTVLVNGEAVRSCLMFAVQANGQEVTTIEGLAAGSKLHPVQEAFWDATACSVVSARLALSCPSTPFFRRIQTRKKKRFARLSPATSAAAQAIKTLWTLCY